MLFIEGMVWWDGDGVGVGVLKLRHFFSPFLYSKYWIVQYNLKKQKTAFFFNITRVITL